MSNRIITIEREYASGGREVGQKVAEKLGIAFYNREILEMASERCGVSVDYLASAEETAPKSFLYTLMLSSNPTRSIEDNLPLSDKVYIVETNIIKELAEKEDCVIVGRCASYILRELDRTFSTFIYADTVSPILSLVLISARFPFTLIRFVRMYLNISEEGSVGQFLVINLSSLNVASFLVIINSFIL